MEDFLREEMDLALDLALTLLLDLTLALGFAACLVTDSDCTRANEGLEIPDKPKANTITKHE